MEFVLLLILFSGLATAAIWSVVLWLGYKAAQAAARNFDTIPALQELQALIAEAQRYQAAGGTHTGPGGGLPPHIQSQFAAKLMRAQADLHQLDRLSRERSELTMAGMISDASALGIDVSDLNR